MLEAIKSFFARNMLPAESATDEQAVHPLHLATAALLIEVSAIDDGMQPEERRTIAEAVRSKFGLSEEETAELLRLAEEEAREATDYHQFTSLINSHFGYAQRVKLVEYLWQVAYADKRLEKYEEYVVRKVADLLYVSHSDFIAAKHRAQQQS